jgi:stage IV sporulation protein FB
MTRDPMSWSIPLFRAFGIQVRLHVLYIIITIGMVGRAFSQDKDHWWEFVIIWVVMLFVIILCHEFGHCFAGRWVNGDAEEILMWPLGGLAYVRVPETPRANFITTAGGPAVNLLFCILAAVPLIAASYQPPLNPINFRQIASPELHNFADGMTHLARDHERFVKKGTTELEYGPIVRVDEKNYVLIDTSERKAIAVEPANLPHYPDWVLWTARFFWLNWLLFLFNVLLPAYPMDGGRLFQCFIWARSDYRNGTTLACYSGYVVAALLFIASLWVVDPLLLALSLFIFFMSYRQLMMLEIGGEDSFMGYDFSQGYTSLEKGEPLPPKPKRPGAFKRWLAARRARRLQREAEQRAADETRLDELLDKVHRLGKEALSDEERRFMDRVSARYRNRS